MTRRFTWLTGPSGLMPRWSLGYSLDHDLYRCARCGGADGGVSGTVRAARSGLHLLPFVVGLYLDRRQAVRLPLEPRQIPDPAAFIASYAEAGVRLVPNIKPALLRSHPRYDEVAAAGLFVADADGEPIEAQFWDEVGSYIDMTKPEAAAWWRDQVTSALLDHGMEATWNDNNEYELWDRRAMVDGFGQPRRRRRCARSSRS